MSEGKESKTAEQIDADRKAFREHQKAHARRIQADRMKFWMIYACIPLVIAAMTLIARYVFETELSENAIAICTAVWFLLRILALPSLLVEQDGPFAQEIVSLPKLVTRQQLTTFLRENLNAIQFSDILLAPLLIFSVAVCLDLLAENWKSAAVGAGWFMGLALYAFYSHLHKVAPERRGKGGAWHAFLLLFLLPSGLNFWWSPDLEPWALYWGTGLRLTATIVMMFAVVALLTVFIWQVEYKLFDALIRLLPARRGLSNRSLKIQNLVAFQDMHLQKEITSGAGASIAVGAIIYWLYNIYPSHWIFAIFSMMAVVPSIIATIIISRVLPISGQRFVRRLGLQSAAMTLILVNALLALGYCVGWTLTKGYLWVFDNFGAFPYPDRFYLFREADPTDLPLVVQIEALIASMVVLFALSWVVYVVQSRAWKEGAIVTCMTGVAAGAPYVDIDVVALFAQYLPNIFGLPQWILAICIPALKGLITGDVEGLILNQDEPSNLTQCKECEAMVDVTKGRFCQGCGNAVVLAPTDPDTSS